MVIVFLCTALSNGYELQCLINWTFFVLVLANCSQEMCTEIVKQAVHIQLIIQLIDLPSASTAHQEVDKLKISMLYTPQINIIII